MLLNYDHEKLRQVFLHFYNLTGISMNFSPTLFVTSNPELVTLNTKFCTAMRDCRKSLLRCDASDRCLYQKCIETKTIVKHTCHAGLVDIAIPIIYEGIFLGSVNFGQIRYNEDFSNTFDKISDLPLDIEQMHQYYNELKLFDDNQLDSVIFLATLLVEHVIFGNLLKPEFEKDMGRTISYITQNLDRPLSVEMLTKDLHISKNVLYRNFRTYFNCTVNEYISHQRINKSLELLCTTDMTIEEISQALGYSNATYFGKIFKKEKGYSPLKFRKLHKPGN